METIEESDRLIKYLEVMGNLDAAVSRAREVLAGIYSCQTKVQIAEVMDKAYETVKEHVGDAQGRLHTI